MGFRTGAYAKVWEVTPMSDTSTKVRMSISRKNKQSGEYEQDFSGFVLAIGTNFKMFSFELDGEEPRDSSTEPQPTVDEGEIDDNRLPF